MASLHRRLLRFHFGPFTVLPDERELRKHGIPLGLQEKPFRLLCALLERAGEVVAREELRKCVWDESFVDFDHGLNVAVSKLREVLHDDAGKPRFIETVPRRGYRFIGKVEREEMEEAVPVAVAPAAAPERAGFSRRRAGIAAGIVAAGLLVVLAAAYEERLVDRAGKRAVVCSCGERR